jgi:hypothetical protein
MHMHMQLSTCSLSFKRQLTSSPVSFTFEGAYILRGSLPPHAIFFLDFLFFLVFSKLKLVNRRVVWIPPDTSPYGGVKGESTSRAHDNVSQLSPGLLYG